MPLKQITFDFAKVEAGDTEVSSSPELQEQPAIISEEKILKAFKAKPVPETITVERKSARGRMKLSDMNASAGLVEVPEDDILFQKSYYSIGAVSDMFKVNQSLIRFWENEFDILKPKKNAKGDRFFRPEDIKNLKMIFHLLRERKYTIEGAKEFLKKNKKADEKFAMIESLKKLKGFLNEIKANF